MIESLHESRGCAPKSRPRPTKPLCIAATFERHNPLVPLDNSGTPNTRTFVDWSYATWDDRLNLRESGPLVLGKVWPSADQ